jgi:hypothetical protein
LWFLKNVQRRADKPGRHAHGPYLAPRAGFAKRIRQLPGALCRSALAA